VGEKKGGGVSGGANGGGLKGSYREPQRRVREVEGQGKMIRRFKKEALIIS